MLWFRLWNSICLSVLDKRVPYLYSKSKKKNSVYNSRQQAMSEQPFRLKGLLSWKETKTSWLLRIQISSTHRGKGGEGGEGEEGVCSIKMTGPQASRDSQMSDQFTGHRQLWGKRLCYMHLPFSEKTIREATVKTDQLLLKCRKFFLPHGRSGTS